MTGKTLNDTSSAAAFLQSRRSYPPKLMRAPYPDDAALKRILTAGMRVPDHKKLEPWRLIVLREQALVDLSDIIAEEAPKLQKDPVKIQKSIDAYRDADLVIAVIASPIKNAPVPDWEQFASAACVAMALVNATLAEGFAAAWLSGIACESPHVATRLGVNAHEQLIGMIHIGSCEAQPPERPRPDMALKVSTPTSL